MILKIRNSVLGKSMSIIMLLIFLITLNPVGSYALTGGPAQPEFNAFTPIGTSDMVDLSSGDFSYNIPLMDIGGFPINLAYSSGVTMDQEASWVGLGFDLSIGQINRQMRGLPDDFDGDKVVYENNIKDNWTVGGTFQFSPEAFGIGLVKDDDGETIDTNKLSLKMGLSAKYNSYRGMSLEPSFGMSFDLAKMGSVGFNATSTPDGLVISPNVSLNPRIKNGKRRDLNLGASFGISFNSRQGLTNVNMSIISDPKRKDVNKKSTYRKWLSAIGSSKSLMPNTYTPTIQANMQTLSGTFNAALGSEFFGGEGEGEITAFLSNQFMVENVENKRAYGYEHTQHAPINGVLDFNREKDGNFTVNSTNLPLTNYTYDLYSVSGQGVGGMFQPFRSQVGYVYDNHQYNSSTDFSVGIELSTGSAAHTGGDFQVTESETKSGIWSENNYPIEEHAFDPKPGEMPDYEEVYFKNVGDLSADQDMGMYDSGKLGKYNPIRFNIGGGPYTRKLNNEYLLKGQVSGGYGIGDGEGIKRTERVKRNQNILKVSKKEAADYSYLNFQASTLTQAKNHHTAGFIITRNDGARYNYGKALYNITKREVTFALGSGIGEEFATIADGDISTGLVSYNAGVDNSIENKHGDHYFNRITTPAYGHTFLLTSLVSTDYSDIDGVEGPSEGDLGSYTKFDYRDMGIYRWRVPFQEDKANYNEGLKTDPTDDKGSYVYGEKETNYIQKIETKTHVALFYISKRRDGFGVIDEDGGIGEESAMYKLDKIALYSKGEFLTVDLDGDGVPDVDADNNILVAPGVTPIKTVHFEYDYSLCPNIINNDNLPETVDGVDLNAGKGKLTLRRVYFTYRNSNMGRFSSYDFTYDNINPEYNLKGYDIWGGYKPNEGTTDGATLDPLSAPEFNFVEQNTTDEKNEVEIYAGAWSLTDISLPSGGKIQIDYESDDYRFVQNKKTMRMFKLAGAGKTVDPATDDVFDFDPNTQTNGEGILFKEEVVGTGEDIEYLYFELDQESQDAGTYTNEDFRKDYLQDIVDNQKSLLQFRMLMNLTKTGGRKLMWSDSPFDYVTGYCQINANQSNVFIHGGKRYGSVKIEKVKREGGFVGTGTVLTNPFSKAGWHFGRKYLSQFVYESEEDDIDGDGDVDAKEIMSKIASSLDGLKELFLGANTFLRSQKIAKRFIPEKSWIRLGEPTKHKKGGGCRVKKLVMTDEWGAMTGDAMDDIMNQEYGQEYEYTREDGGSSGVATYEPVGSKENPWVQPVFVNVNRMLAPDEENYMEKPFGESFFPSPKVTYSRVTVKNLERIKEDGKVVKKHATGKVVTEFYTSKDFPVLTDQTILHCEEDSNPLLASLLQVNIVKHLTATQGYLVHTNDMDGKMKAQWVYGEDQTSYMSGVEYIYGGLTPEDPGDWAGDPDYNEILDNKGKLNNNVLTIDPNGTLSHKDIGVEYNIINDFREMRSVSIITGMDINAAFYTIGPLPIIVPVPIPDFVRHADQLRLATTTKVINTYGILRETVAHDAGASVSTKNIAWDSETGEVLVTETVNEFGDKYYSFNYPSHWMYKGMGQAARNSGIYSPITEEGSGYKMDGIALAKNYLFPGDEVLLTGDIDHSIAWVSEVSDGSTFYLIDESGNPIDISSGSIKVIRSGHRNIQSTSMGSIVMMKNPISIIYGEGGSISEDFLNTSDWNDFNIVNSGAVEFYDQWGIQCECGIDSDGEVFNPYRFNALGVWRANKSYLYLTGRHHSNVNPNTRDDGFYTTFKPYYSISTMGGTHWKKPVDGSLGKWTFTSEVTQYSPYGFELENQDALGRYSSAQYGYNFSFPLAVAANASYTEMGFDGFEDYNFEGCDSEEHFGFRNDIDDNVFTTSTKSHTGRYCLRVAAGVRVENLYRINCEE